MRFTDTIVYLTNNSPEARDSQIKIGESLDYSPFDLRTAGHLLASDLSSPSPAFRHIVEHIDTVTAEVVCCIAKYATIWNVDDLSLRSARARSLHNQ